MGIQPASITEVEKRAGVTVASASRVLSSSTYQVSVETRRKVLKAAEELSYTPNSLARSLRAQRSNLIAVLVGDNTDPYFAEIMRGVEDVANESGYLTIVCNSDRTPTKELHYLRVLQDYRIDGVIFAGSALNESGYPEQLEKVVQAMMDRGAAVVTLAQHTLHVPSVQADNFGGAHEMTARLIASGHRRTAGGSRSPLVAGGARWSPGRRSGRSRRSAYLQDRSAAGCASHARPAGGYFRI